MDANTGAETTRGGHAADEVQLGLVVGSDLARLGLTRVARGAGIVVVAEEREMDVALDVLRESTANVVLVQPTPVADDHEGLRAFIRSVPQQVVVVLDAGDHRLLVEALAAGACACVEAAAAGDEVIAAIRAARGERLFVSPSLVQSLVRRLHVAADNPPASPPELTAREREVLTFIARGWDNAQIAEYLYLSPATIKHHIASIFVKLKVDNRVQAAVRAVREGLDEAGP